jgi:tRNA(fMet)-specific endonuclease VapC
MRLHYLIDTDWVIHWTNGNADIVARLAALRPEGLALSMASLAELYEGVYYSTNPTGNEKTLHDFLRAVSVLGLDIETCQRFGRERGRLRAARKLIGDMDLLIGVTALRHDLTLLTNNRRHFELIEGLRIESQ